MIQRGQHRVGHLKGGDGGDAGFGDVWGADALGHDAAHRALQQVRQFRRVEGVTQAQGEGQDGPNGIGDPLPRDIGRRAVDRFVKRAAAAGVFEPR
ncbi:hypothetical protein D3C80_1784640 [compost metagenome]